jgi:Ca2+-binding EF-hand superfamily protein
MEDIAKELKMPPPDSSEIDDTLKEFDKNKDKKIELSEFLALFRVLFEMKNKK